MSKNEVAAKLNTTKGNFAKPKRTKNPLKVKLFIFCMLCLPLLQFIVFTVYVNIDGVLMTLFNVDFSSNELKFVGLGNYRKFFANFTDKNNENFIRTITNSLGYWPIVYLISTPLQVITAYFLYKKVPAAKFIIVMIFLPNLIPPAVLSQSFTEMLSIRQGPLNALLMKLMGFNKETVPIWLADEKYAMMILYIFRVGVGIGYNATLVWGAMTRTPTEIVEASHLDGIGFWGEFRHIILPIAWPTISMILITSACIPFTMYMHSQLLTNGGQADTGTLALMAVQLLRNGDMYYSATVSVILSMVSIPIMLVVKHFLNKIYDDVQV